MSAERDARSEQIEIAARVLHRHVCGTEWDEWNNPCSWAGEDAEPGLKSYPVCCEVDLSDLAGAVVDALSTRVLPSAAIRLGSCCANVGTDACTCENPTNWGSVVPSGGSEA